MTLASLNLLFSIRFHFLQTYAKDVRLKDIPFVLFKHLHKYWMSFRPFWYEKCNNYSSLSFKARNRKIKILCFPIPVYVCDLVTKKSKFYVLQFLVQILQKYYKNCYKKPQKDVILNNLKETVLQSLCNFLFVLMPNMSKFKDIHTCIVHI